MKKMLYITLVFHTKSELIKGQIFNM